MPSSSSNEQFYQMLLSLFMLAVQFGIFVLTVIFAILDRRFFRKHWKPGLIWGLIILVLLLPAAIQGVLHFDPDVVLRQMGKEGDRAFEIGMQVGLWIGFLANFLFVGWYLVVYVVAAGSWAQLRDEPYPVLEGQRTWNQLATWGALLFGILFGALSTVVFLALEIEVGEGLKRMLEWFPTLEQTPATLQIAIALGFVCSAAVYEEFLFRGVLYGGLARIFGADGGAWGLGGVVAAGISSAVWASVHIGNTNRIEIKLAQIFLFGLVLAWLARRHSMAAAIAAHVGLNVGAVLFAFALAPTLAPTPT